MKRSLSLFAAALALALTATAQSQADPFSYTYNWAATPIAIGAGTGGVTLTDETAVTTTAPTDTAATNVAVFSAASSTAPDVIAAPASGHNYSLTLTVADSNGTGTGSVTFTGLLQGSLTHDSSNLTNTITGSSISGTPVAIGETAGAGSTSAEIIVNGSEYTVSYNGFAAPGPEAQHNVGSISFHIDVKPVSTQGTSDSPEPSSMVLGCLGLVVVGGVVYRARRRNAAMLKAAI